MSTNASYDQTDRSEQNANNKGMAKQWLLQTYGCLTNASGEWQSAWSRSDDPNT